MRLGEDVSDRNDRLNVNLDRLLLVLILKVADFMLGGIYVRHTGDVKRFAVWL